jgi:hypothetical protein
MATARTATYKGVDVGMVRPAEQRLQAKRVKVALITTPATADDTDTVAIDLALLGISDTGLLAVRGITHTTANSVLVIETPTTVVASGTLTITIGGSTDNLVRGFMIIGEEA